MDSNGVETRYVIDFYKGSTAQAIRDQKTSQNGSSSTAMPVIAMHLDVRPAVDTPTAMLLRLRVFFWRLVGFNPFSNVQSKK